jgi:hypothetical protein
VKVLLVLHAAAAIVAIGSATHAAVLAIRAWTGRGTRPKLRRTYAVVTAISYGVCFLLGLWIYPTFRVEVRAAHFDVALPWATAAFEVKEHWAGLGLFCAAALVPLVRTVDPRRRDSESRAFAVLTVMLAVVVWYTTFCGLSLTALRPI